MTAVAIIFVFFVVPLWLLLHYVTTWRNNRGLGKEDMKNIEDIWQLANKLEARINNLETILTDDTGDKHEHL